MVQLPPPPNDTPLVPPAVNSTNSGMVFFQSGSKRNINVSTDDTINPGNSHGTISMVNGRPINVYIYYSNEYFISQLLRQLFVPILHMVGQFPLTIFKCIEPSSTVRIGAVISTTVLYIVQIHFNPNVFHHPIIFKSEHLNGSRLGIHTWDDIACVGKHEFVE